MDIEPGKYIKSNEDLKAFLNSPTCNSFLFFVSQSLIHAIMEGSSGKSAATVASKEERDDSNVIKEIEKVLEKAKGLIEAYPPVQQSNRFGNKSYRDWHNALSSQSVEMMKNLLQSTTSSTNNKSNSLSSSSSSSTDAIIDSSTANDNKQIGSSSSDISKASNTSTKPSKSGKRRKSNANKEKSNQYSASSSITTAATSTDDVKSLTDDLASKATIDNKATSAQMDNKEEKAINHFAKELSEYWIRSFGEPTRLDYGTGHETTFAMWLFSVLSITSTINDKKILLDCAEKIFPLYFSVCTRLQRTYMLEPAGSHGVWSLDDYFFLPFVFGSAQMMKSQTVKPKSIRSTDVIESMSSKNMFFGALRYILDTKHGPFQEHSPLLYALAGASSWEQIHRGLIKMYKAEVLGKFPVAQHFIFGTVLRPTWVNEISETEKPPSTVSPTPFSMMRVSDNASDFDVLGKYFGISSIQPAPGMGGGAMTMATGLQHQMMPINDTAFPKAGAMPPAGVGASLASSSLSTMEMMKVSSQPAFKIVHKLVDNGKGIEIYDANETIEASPFANKLWKITAFTTDSIASETQLNQVREANPDLDFPIPEMCFFKNHLTISNIASGITIQFLAMEALRGIRIKQLEDGQDDRIRFKVSHADLWKQKKDQSGQEIKTWRDDFDWTYTTTYQGSIYKENSDSDKPLSQDQAKEKMMITPIPTTKGIDYDLLRLREPILWNSHAVLFEDDLFDSGVTQLSVKIRVMPSCFFVLLRDFIRVDNTHVRIFDVRYFHKYGTSSIIVETSRKEASYELLIAALGTISNTSLVDPDITGKTLDDVLANHPERHILSKRATYEIPLS